MLTDKGRLLLNFFCQIVDDVIAINAIIVAIKPNIGMSLPKSKPKTNTAPINPRIAPIVQFKFQFLSLVSTFELIENFNMPQKRNILTAIIFKLSNAVI